MPIWHTAWRILDPGSRGVMMWPGPRPSVGSVAHALHLSLGVLLARSGPSAQLWLGEYGPQAEHLVC